LFPSRQAKHRGNIRKSRVLSSLCSQRSISPVFLGLSGDGSPSIIVLVANRPRPRARKVGSVVWNVHPQRLGREQIRSRVSYTRWAEHAFFEHEDEHEHEDDGYPRLLLRNEPHQTLLKLYSAKSIERFSLNPKPVPELTEKRVLG
jgi:hypothetical protein